LQGNTAEYYLNRLKNDRRRRKEYIPVANALAVQFAMDYKQVDLNLGNFVPVTEYDVTKIYRVTEQNSNVEFDVTFYFYGGIISGWSVEPGKESFENYIKRIITESIK